MTLTFIELVDILSRTARRCRIEGDMDIEEVDDLLGLVPSFASEITPELAEACDNAIGVIQEYLAVQMKHIIQSNGAIQKSKRALRGYQDIGLKSQPMRVFRNV